jgi:hypothetical protein
MLNFFLLAYFTPCNVGLYSSARSKNELGKKKSTLQGASHQKRIYRGKNKTHLGKDSFTLYFFISLRKSLKHSSGSEKCYIAFEQYGH